ncbi:MAG: hypothetical protein AVO35_03700 [Candidatus Aegiribacteria sp. MLS_C]|nr:MAG: hypothetical protein AVO35_03700 [Candidatus Aegiribacteria sp. MLS_C]
MNKFRFVRGGVLVMLLTVPAAGLGQWSPDSLQNLAICDLSGEQSVSKIAATSDGGCFVSWFDSRSGSYCMYIQRLDSLGQELLGDDGLLVSDHPQESWLVDYDLAVDGEDNAILAFCDIRYTGVFNVTAYKIAGDGSFLWGDDGICLSDTTGNWFEAAPRIAVTPDGNSVICWGRSDAEFQVVFQKLSPSGERLWGDYGMIWSGGDADLSAPVVVPAGQDSVVALWKSSTGSFPSQVTHLYTQKMDVSGDLVWGDTYVLVYDGGAITPWNYPEIIPDGSGGAIYAWYDSPTLSDFNVWVQRMDEDGNMLFPMNGAQASTNSADRLHMNPSVAYYPSDDATFVLWVETNDNQTDFGVYGQRLSSTGAREWGDSGLQLVPLGGDQVSFVRSLSLGGGIYAAYLSGSMSTALRVVRLQYDGNVEWGPVTLSASSLGGKDDLVRCAGYGESALYAWTDYRNDYGIYAQNVNPSGTLGPQTGISLEVSTTGAALSLLPNPCSGWATVTIDIPVTSHVTVEVFDLSGRIVERLADGMLERGRHSVNWDSAETPGVYFVRLGIGSQVITRRLAVL